MKKLLFTAIILLMVSCSGGKEMEIDCGCVEVQERFITTKSQVYPFWETSTWEKSGVKNNLEDCYTDEEILYAVRTIGSKERWFITCSNN